MEAALKNRVIDVGITYLPIPDPELDFLKVTTIDMGLFAHKSLPKPKEILDLDFITPNISLTGTPSKVQGLDGWPDHRLPRKVRHQVAMLQGALILCRKGQGAGYFPKFVVERYNQGMSSHFKLEEIPLPKKLNINTKQDVYLVKRKTDLESPFLKKLAKQLRQLRSHPSK